MASAALNSFATPWGIPAVDLDGSWAAIAIAMACLRVVLGIVTSHVKIESFDEDPGAYSGVTCIEHRPCTKEGSKHRSWAATT